MKIALQDGKNYILRFDKGEELFAELSKFLSENKVAASSFTALGTCSTVEMGYYNAFLKEYRKKPYVEDLEIVSLTGNTSMLDGAPAVHAHGVFSKNDFTSVVAGHIFKLIVLATCEVSLVKLDGTLQRAHNGDLNLNLLS